jgi:hypothetical protein
VKLSVGGEIINAHKVSLCLISFSEGRFNSITFWRKFQVILAASSPYFYAMFNGNYLLSGAHSSSASRHASAFLLHVVYKIPDDMLERNKDVVELHDIDAPSLKQLIDFAYTGECIITEENVQVWTNFVSLSKSDYIIHFTGPSASIISPPNSIGS